MNIRTIREIMSTHYAKVTEDQALVAAIDILKKYHQSAIPVVGQNSQLCGIVSEADCMRAALVEGYHNQSTTLVKDIMVSDTDTISPDTELSSAMQVFLDRRRRMMPVVEAGNLVGILTRADILEALV